MDVVDWEVGVVWAVWVNQASQQEQEQQLNSTTRPALLVKTKDLLLVIFLKTLKVRLFAKVSTVG